MRTLSIGELNPTRCAGDPAALARFVTSITRMLAATIHSVNPCHEPERTDYPRPVRTAKTSLRPRSLGARICRSGPGLRLLIDYSWVVTALTSV